MKRYNVLIGVVVLVVVIGGAFLLMHKKSDNSTNSTAMAGSGPAAATITYSSSGFSPATITVKSGDTVAIKNTDSDELQLDSDPHPVHTDDTDLNVGVVKPGETKTFMVMKKGSFGYHNHLEPSNTGKIVVQ